MAAWKYIKLTRSDRVCDAWISLYPDRWTITESDKFFEIKTVRSGLGGKKEALQKAKEHGYVPV